MRERGWSVVRSPGGIGVAGLRRRPLVANELVEKAFDLCTVEQTDDDYDNTERDKNGARAMVRPQGRLEKLLFPHDIGC